VLFPILKKYNESIALGYVGFRLLEGILFIFMVINSLSQISLSQEYLNSGAGEVSYFQTLGNSIQAQNAWATLIYIIVFTLGALMFYYLLYKSKIIPWFISVWGLIAAVLLLTGALLGMLDLIPLPKAMVFFGSPIALNEIVLAVWLIAKGFNSSAIAYESGKTDIDEIWWARDTSAADAIVRPSKTAGPNPYPHAGLATSPAISARSSLIRKLRRLFSWETHAGSPGA
jgi:hypothetical protein